MSSEDVALLDELVEAWRDTRDPRLEPVIARFGRLLASQRPLVIKRGKAAIESQWDALAKRPDAVAITQLFDLPWPEDRAVIKKRLARLAKLKADPRITTSLAARTFALSRAGNGHADVDDLLANLYGILYRAPTALSLAYAKSNADLLRRGLGRAPDDEWPPPTKQASPELLARIAARMPTDVDGLFAAVYANPGDIGPRLVLADALQQIGDPRGEFIALQCAISSGTADATAKARTVLLEAMYGAEWIGPLPGGGFFENGFVAELYTAHSIDDAMVEALFDRPEWSTIHTLHLLPGPGQKQLDASKLVARLPILRRLSAHSLDWLKASDKLECIAAQFEPWSYDRAAFPKLRVLACPAPEGDLGPPLEAAKTRGLDAIAYYDVDATRFADALAARDRGPRELRLDLTHPDGNNVWVRTQGRFAAIGFTYEGRPAVSATTLLKRLREAGFTRVAIWCPEDARDTVKPPRSSKGLEIVDGVEIDPIAPFTPISL